MADNGELDLLNNNNEMHHDEKSLSQESFEISKMKVVPTYEVLVTEYQDKGKGEVGDYTGKDQYSSNQLGGNLPTNPTNQQPQNPEEGALLVWVPPRNVSL